MRKPAVRRHLIARALSCALLAAAGLASPVPGRAIVCTARVGCPTAAPAPALSATRLARIISRYLAQHPPVVRLDLVRPLRSSVPMVAYADLAKAGELRTIDATPGREADLRYSLTVQGSALVARFHGAKRTQPDASVIEIQVGQFQYVPGSAVVHYDELNDPAATFKFYFRGNENASTLLRLGPAMDWVIADYPEPHLSLDGLDRINTQTFPLLFCRGRWVIRARRCLHP